MRMLGKKDFDKKLIGIIKNYNSGKAQKIILVFDSIEPMGDKVEINRTISVIYSPKDKFYQSADDKICELLERIGGADIDFPANEEYHIVTEDNDLVNRINKISERKKKEFKIISSSVFAETVKLKSFNDNNVDKEKLNPEEIDKINQELKDIW